MLDIPGLITLIIFILLIIVETNWWKGIIFIHLIIKFIILKNNKNTWVPQGFWSSLELWPCIYIYIYIMSPV